LPALKYDLEAVDALVAAANGAERCTGFERPGELQRIDAERPRNVSGRIAADNSGAPNGSGMDHIA